MTCRALTRVLAATLLSFAWGVEPSPAFASDNAFRRADSPVVPFEELLRRPVRLRPQLTGKHPRIFFTAASLAELRAHARDTRRELWAQTVKGVRALEENPPAPGAPELDRAPAQYDAAYTLAEATFAYAVGRDPRYLEAAKRWLLTVIRYDPWGYTYRTPNVDLPPAHLLYAVGFAYDTLYHELSAGERAAVRGKLARQARLMYDYFKYKPKKRYAYSQNHSFIPMTGLAVAAFALMGEEPEADEWAALSRAVYDRVLLTFGHDGYYYEGFHYMVFSLHWVVRYLDALEHATGEDLYPRMRERFAPLKYYVAHSILPDGRTVFDFGDTGRGAAERNRKSGGALNSGYEVLYRLAAKYRDAEAQGVADWLRRGLKHATWEDHWAFYAHDPSLRPSPVGKLPTSHFFQNNGTVFWRSGWDARATAFAFRAAPPEGHHVTALLPHVPDWRLSTGHAHPDANSFIIYAHGKYLTGDTGYTGVKRTSDHNTVLVDGRGQSDDGRHEVFKEVPYEQLDRIRVVETWATPEYFYARGEAASAYPPELKLTRFDRHFLYVAPDYFLVWDELAAAEPRRFSWMLNAEQAINELAPRQFVLASGGAGLLVEQLVAPAAARAEILPQVVTAQGRPGSIERGVEEQRGVQLVLHTDASEREGEFLHFFRPLEILSTAREEKQEGEPQVAPLRTGAARAVKINWPGGDTEVALLRRDARGEIVELVTDAARAIARVSPAGAWRRLILHNGTHLSRGGVAFLRASRRASITLTSQAGDASWRGTISADGPASISVCVARRPRRLLLGGAQVRFEYDAARRTVTFEVGAGQSSVEGL